jgi:hypothetical protein
MTKKKDLPEDAAAREPLAEDALAGYLLGLVRAMKAVAAQQPGARARLEESVPLAADALARLLAIRARKEQQ